jgi:hypothetical protein
VDVRDLVRDHPWLAGALELSYDPLVPAVRRAGFRQVEGKKAKSNYFSRGKYENQGIRN